MMSYYTTYCWGCIESEKNVRLLDIDENEKFYRKDDPMPLLEWQLQSLLWFTNIPREDQQVIEKYVSYDYRYMNMNLRLFPNSNAHMNKIIETAPALLNDIYVYRYTKYIPENSTWKYNGYISTSFLASYTASACSEEGYNMLRIFVPKGTKCVYVPSREYEIIFPHGLTIETLDSQEIKSIDIKPIKMYNLKIVG